MTRLDNLWMKDRQYWHFENGVAIVHADAPKEVKASYEHYLKQHKEAQKRGTL